MKVFISHKKEDDTIARSIQIRFLELYVDSYLDLIDDINLNGKELTEHLKKRMNECTDLLVIMSEKTKDSMWVPFEVGMASQKDFPIVNYLESNVKLPDFLEYWPRIRRLSELDIYVKEKKNIEEKYYFDTGETRTSQFYKNLKAKLY